MKKTSDPIKIFVSYSHKDKVLKEKLDSHLSVLKHNGVIDVWHDRKIIGGEEGDKEIDENLESSHIILLLISANFNSSDYCYKIEMPSAMERHDAGEAKVIPIILKPTDWKDTPFRKLQALPEDGKPVTKWRLQDEAFLNITEGIRDVVSAISSSPTEKASKASELGGVFKAIEPGQLICGQIIQNRMTLLNSICKNEQYSRGWKTYTHLDVNDGDHAVSIDHDVQIIHADEEKTTQLQDRTERRKIDALNGLRKYAPEHVLLVGRAGSGKSSILKRLLIEEAEKAKTDSDLRIPIFIEMRYYNTNILELIRGFLLRHGLRLSCEDIETLLFNGCFTLIVDGLNELPTESSWRAVSKFRKNFINSTHMIFSTRDVGMGGGLSIEKKLEVLPLTEKQTRDFINAYTTNNADNILSQIEGNIRELSSTPLFLWMLCSVFREKDEIRFNIAKVFRLFMHHYVIHIKGDIPVKKSSRKLWHEILKHLAFKMMKGDNLIDLRTAIPWNEAEEIIYQYLSDKGHSNPAEIAVEIIDQLMNYFIIQSGEGGKIEFRHQMIQEYYVAEFLHDRLPELVNEENLERQVLKRDYMNYLKWTEPLTLMMGLIDDDNQAIRVVQLAMEVDIMLGAKLASAVNEDFQKTVIDRFLSTDLPKLPKILIMEKISSEFIIPFIEAHFRDDDTSVQRFAVRALQNIGTKKAIDALIRALNHYNTEVRSTAADVMGKLGKEHFIQPLIRALKDDASIVRSEAASALGEIGSEEPIYALIKALVDEDSSVRMWTIQSLGKINSEQSVDVLIDALNGTDSEDIFWASNALAKNGTEKAINALIESLNNKKSLAREDAAQALGKIGDQRAIDALVQVLNDDDPKIRGKAVYALGDIGNKNVIDVLSLSMNDNDSHVRWCAANALGKIGGERIVSILIQALEDNNSETYKNVIEALGETKSEKAVEILMEILTNKQLRILLRLNAAESLGKIGSEKAADALIDFTEKLKFIDELHFNDYQNASLQRFPIEALGKIGDERSLDILILKLTHKNPYVNESAAKALGNIGGEKAVNALIQSLHSDNLELKEVSAEALSYIENKKAVYALFDFINDESLGVSVYAASSLELYGTPDLLPSLKSFLYKSSEKSFMIKNIIEDIQERCKYYNHDLKLSE